MPLKLKLIYVLCCLIDIVAYIYHREWLGFASAFPVLCLLTFYFLQRKGDYKLKDYTYSFGLLLAAVADITFEFRTNNAKAISMIFFMLSFSFYIATVRKETVFTASSKEFSKIFLNLLLIIAPFFIVFSEMPAGFFFSSIIYMVFLSLFYITALLRKTNKSSYQWLIAGALAFALLTVCEAYFTFIIKVPYDGVITKVIYGFAQYVTFMGIITTFKNFYPASEK
ncbi:lysoplasmalogenase family protein [Emticicia agri]|uniref:Lysoplasmalogenase n=1 Tax=Emticicia agri TaxID=2492393 RepID=A0A4Q5LYN9_9BACT|nr:lysoplasmalogenase family protein [Emticicia agri]RYU94912.1 hypothetical protein EWM59_14570 [Emticicia agri]